MLVLGMLQVLHCLKKMRKLWLVHLMSCRLEIYEDDKSIQKIKQIMVVSAFLHSFEQEVFYSFFFGYSILQNSLVCRNSVGTIPK